MTSFLFRGSFAKENNSKVYSCFVDVRQAFDRVSRHILLTKLYKTGTNKSLFKLVYSLFQDAYSCLKTKGIPPIKGVSSEFFKWTEFS